MTEAEFHRQFDTNVLSTILTTSEAAATFDGRGGSIINVSSISSFNPVPNSVVYSASKAAVDTITTALAKDLASRKIRGQCDRTGHDGDRRPRGGRHRG